MVLSGTCSACGAHSTTLRGCRGLCGGGPGAAYCSKACQSRHWKSGHKRTCGMVPNGFTITVQAESGRAVLRCTDEDKNMHPFCNLDGKFFKELATYLEDEPELVEIEYLTSIKVAGSGETADDANDGDDDNKFVRNCNLPRAAVERAQQDSDFDHGLSHSVALAYDDELLAAARASNGEKCVCGSDEVAKIFHCPITKFHPDRYALTDVFARPCCSNGECMRKIQGNVIDFQRDMAQFMQERGLPTGEIGMVDVDDGHGQ